MDLGTSIESGGMDAGSMEETRSVKETRFPTVTRSDTAPPRVARLETSLSMKKGLDLRQRLLTSELGTDSLARL